MRKQVRMQMNADDKIKVKTQNVVKFPVQSTCRITKCQRTK